MSGGVSSNYMDRFLGWLESTTPGQRLAAAATSASEIPAPAELVAEWRTLGEQDGEANPFRTGYRAALRKCADELELSLGIQAVRVDASTEEAP